MVVGYNEDASIPVYEWTSSIKNVQEILPILLKPPELAKTCIRVPTAVSHNLCFVLDTSKLKRHEDWKCDDMGSWKNNGVQHHILANPYGIVGSLEEYALKRIYFKTSRRRISRKFSRSWKVRNSHLLVNWICNSSCIQQHLAKLVVSAMCSNNKINFPEMSCALTCEMFGICKYIHVQPKYANTLQTANKPIAWLWRMLFKKSAILKFTAND